MTQLELYKIVSSQSIFTTKSKCHLLNMNDKDINFKFIRELDEKYDVSSY